MLNRLLQEFYKSPNNGRQIVQLDDRTRLVLTHSKISGPCEIGLRAIPDKRADDLASVRGVDLVGTRSQIGVPTELGLGACILRDNDDHLHLMWTSRGGLQHTQASLRAVTDPASWSPPEPVISGDAWLGDVLQIGDWPSLLYRYGQEGADGICVAYLKNGRWNTSQLWMMGPVWPPVGAVDDVHRAHIAWGDVNGNLWYGTASPSGEPEGEPLRISRQGQQPSIAIAGDRTLIVYEDRFSHIHYSALHDGKVADEGPVTWRNPWFTGDMVHSPQLAVDRHGVAWCFFPDNTRRSTFWTRWMGEGFGEIYNGPRLHYRPPHFDWNLLPIGRLSVEREGSSSEIGMVIGLEGPLEGQAFRTVSVPDHPSDASSKVLFLDGLEVAEMKGVDLTVQEARRHTRNPLIDVGPEGSFDSDRVFNHGTVLNDGVGYRMWYGAIHEPLPVEKTNETDLNDEDRTNPQSVPWWDTITCGYAESEDGVDWKRTHLGLAEWNGTKDNNLVPHLRHAPLMIRDDDEQDPNRRYKSLYLWNSGEMCEMAGSGKYGVEYDLRDEYFPAILFTSPDGIDLTPHDARVIFSDGDAKPFSIIPQSLFRDDAEPDPARRWKAYGFTSLNLRRRGTAMIYSEDALTWYAHSENPVLDPSVRGTPAIVGGPESQIHDTVVFPYAGYYLALYQCQHNSEILDVELAMSRDGETFVHIQPGSKILPLGPEGSWESEHLFPTVPVILDEEVRIYYGGGRMIDVPLEDRARLGSRTLKVLPGLATLRKDGFTSVGLREEGRGSLTTLPFQLKEPCRLQLNANCKADCWIAVEVLEPTTPPPLDGYSIQDCDPVTEDDIAFPVRWRESTDLPIGVLMRVRFHFRGDTSLPRLYSYSFDRSA